MVQMPQDADVARDRAADSQDAPSGATLGWWECQLAAAPTLIPSSGPT